MFAPDRRCVGLYPKATSCDSVSCLDGVGPESLRRHCREDGVVVRKVAKSRSVDT